MENVYTLPQPPSHVFEHYCRSPFESPLQPQIESSLQPSLQPCLRASSHVRWSHWSHWSYWSHWSHWKQNELLMFAKKFKHLVYHPFLSAEHQILTQYKILIKPATAAAAANATAGIGAGGFFICSTGRVTDD